MTTPVIIFDHINKVMTAVLPGAATDKRIDEILEAQRSQHTTSGSPQK